MQMREDSSTEMKNMFILSQCNLSSHAHILPFRQLLLSSNNKSAQGKAEFRK